jgi:hypothetical protein
MCQTERLLKMLVNSLFCCPLLLNPVSLLAAFSLHFLPFLPFPLYFLPFLTFPFCPFPLLPLFMLFLQFPSFLRLPLPAQGCNKDYKKGKSNMDILSLYRAHFLWLATCPAPDKITSIYIIK